MNSIRSATSSTMPMEAVLVRERVSLVLRSLFNFISAAVKEGILELPALAELEAVCNCSMSSMTCSERGAM